MRPRAPEKIVQLDVKRLYRQFGGVVYDFSQGYRPGGRRHGSTRQTPGIPDLFVCFSDRGKAFWHEVKTEDGCQTTAQRGFQDVTERSGVPYVLGGTTAAVEQLRAIGFRLEM